MSGGVGVREGYRRRVWLGWTGAWLEGKGAGASQRDKWGLPEKELWKDGLRGCGRNKGLHWVGVWARKERSSRCPERQGAEGEKKNGVGEVKASQGMKCRCLER